MKPGATRCKWEVHAGLIPGEGESLYHREWSMTVAEWNDGLGHTEFGEKQAAAITYVAELQFKGATNRAAINWVALTFVWY